MPCTIDILSSVFLLLPLRYSPPLGDAVRRSAVPPFPTSEWPEAIACFSHSLAPTSYTATPLLLSQKHRYLRTIEEASLTNLPLAADDNTSANT